MQQLFPGLESESHLIDGLPMLASNGSVRGVDHLQQLAVVLDDILYFFVVEGRQLLLRHALDDLWGGDPELIGVLKLQVRQEMCENV